MSPKVPSGINTDVLEPQIKSQCVYTFGRSFLASRPRKVMVSTVVIPEDKTIFKNRVS